MVKQLGNRIPHSGKTWRLPWRVLCVWYLTTAALFAQTPLSGDATNNRSVLLVIQGTVEVCRTGTNDWQPARMNQELQPGDRLRTGIRSRAEVRLSNQTVLPVNESTTLTFEVPATPDRLPIINLGRGTIYLQSRERPGWIQFRTRLVSGAIRGTEFNLAAEEDGPTILSLLDGEVELNSGSGQLTLSGGEQAVIRPGQAPQKTPLINATNVIQWTFYYPGVLAVDELEFSAAEKQTLAPSLAAYREGDLMRALAEYPTNRPPVSSTERVYYAALLLAVGQADQAQRQLDAAAPQVPAAARPRRLDLALQQLIAAVKNQSWTSAAPPTTATEWMAESYYQQSRMRLSDAWHAAQKATDLSPGFGFAWERLAELEFGFGRTAEAQRALQKALALSPRNAQAASLNGFLLSAQNRIRDAIRQFDAAIAMDGTLGDAWLGRGLCKIRQGNAKEGIKDLQVAAALEPMRATFRSYLGKAYDAGDDRRARKVLDRARQLDPNDPTAWLYSALVHQQQNEINQAVRDLETSKELNDNRQLFRSRLLLDQDRAVRGANLATIYQEAGTPEISLREARQAVGQDYANYSAHRFLADSYNALRDPRQVNLRYETPWFTEFLLANLLAPAAAGTLSQYVTQNEYSKLFEHNRLGISSSTEYCSGGDWVQSGSQFGYYNNFGYALDVEYRSENGQRPNNDLNQLTLSAKIKQQITPQDSFYLQSIYYDSDAGDLAQYYAPDRSAHLRLRAKETQEPILLAGYHHEWQPGMHTLFLASRLQDTYQVTDPSQTALLLLKDNTGQVIGVPKPGRPLAPLDYQSEFEAYSVELQQIWQQDRYNLVLGSRYQNGGFDTQSRLNASAKTYLGNDAKTWAGIFQSPAIAQDYSPDLERVSVYGYFQYQVADPFWLTAGVSYDRLVSPLNYRTPPISLRQETTDQVSPKAGIIWTPFRRTTVRGNYTRSLGGVSYDQSFRLEPTQVAGINQAYRSIVPESAVGSLTSPRFDSWGLALDQKFGTGTYLTLEASLLRSEDEQTVGAIDITDLTIFPAPSATYAPSGTRTRSDYEERNLGITVNQLIGRNWGFGVRYRLSDSDLETDFPQIPATVSSAAHSEEQATLHQVTLFTQFNHRSGLFGWFESLWSQQSNRGYSPDIPGDDFWHFNVFVGYRFPRRYAELKLGVLNLTDQDYHLNPLSLYPEYRRDRTYTVNLKFFF